MSRTIMITGATDGIGLATATALASQGHNVLLHGRNPEKLARVVDTLQALPGAAALYSYQADLSDLTSIRAMVNTMLTEHYQLDVLINNAGIFKTAETRTPQGLDVRFAVNTFAPILLTRYLQELFTVNSRVVNLSSAAQAPISLAALSGDESIAKDFDAYAQSKLALTIWTRQTALKQGAEGPAMIAVNPGSLLASKMVKEGFGVAGNDLSIGVDILSRAALDGHFAQPQGRYFDNDSGQFAEPHPEAQDIARVAALMERIETVLSRLPV